MQIYMQLFNFEKNLLIILHLFLDITLLLFSLVFMIFSHIVNVLVVSSSSGYDRIKRGKNFFH